MALLTAAELKASREARESGVDDVTDADATLAISEAEQTLYSYLGYAVQSSDTSVTLYGAGDSSLWLPQRARTVSAVTVDGTAIGTTTYRIAVGGFVLQSQPYWVTNSAIVVTGTFGYASTDREYILAKRAVKILGVRFLRQHDPNSGPFDAAGAFLTGIDTGDQSYRFFTPEGEPGGTGYADVDQIAKQIGLHPRKSKKGLKQLLMRSSGYIRGTNELDD